MSADAIRDMLLTARMQASLASAVYGGRDGVARLAESVIARFRYYESANVAAGVLIFDDHIHLSVAGSDDDYDWAINRNRNLKQVELLQVHEGYWDSAGWLVREITRSEFPTLTAGRRLYVGGHSAGGAIAEILPVRDMRFRPHQIFTFGSPKWCSRLSAALYSAFPWQTYRFTMSGDPVPYLPLNSWRQLLGRPGFAHTAPGMEVSDDGDVLSVDGMTLARRLYCTAHHIYRHGVFGLLSSIGNLRETIAANHGIARYRAAIEIAAGRY